MPLGVSEGLLQKAYGPIDFSGFYKHIDDFAKQAAAETKAQKQALQKEYYTNEALYNRRTDKARDADIPKIIEYHNKAKNIELSLIANPNMQNNNPEEYYKRKEQADYLREKGMSLSRTGKELQNDINSIGKSYVANQKKFEDNTLQTIKDLSTIPTDEIIEKNLWDKDKLIYKGVDTSKFYKGFEDSIKNTSGAVIKDVRANVKQGELGTLVGDLYDVYDPFKIVSATNSYVDNLGKNKEKVSSQIMSSVYNSGDLNRYWEKYNSIPDSEWAKFQDSKGNDIFSVHSPDGLNQTRKPLINKPEGETTADLKSWLTLKQLVDGFPSNAKKSNVEFTPEGKTALGQRKAEAATERGFSNKKEWTKWSYKFHQEHPNVGENILNIGGAIWNQLGKDAKNAANMIRLLPGGLNGGVFKAGEKGTEFNKGAQALAVKAGLDPNKPEDVEKIKNMSVEELSQKTGVFVDDLKAGIITSYVPGDDTKKAQSEVYKGDITGLDNFANTHSKDFGSKAQNQYLASQAKAIMNMGSVYQQNEGVEKTPKKPAEKKVKLDGSKMNIKDFNSQYQELPSGQTYVGPDGKTYTKK